MGTSRARERLARQVTGAVFDGSDPAAAAETAGFNTAVTHRPAVVVAAQQRADVAAAVRYAHDEGLPVTVQATGHGADAPAEGTVFVSTRRMQGLQVDPVARVARVEAGVRWRQVIDAAVPHGLAPLSGSSSGVGVVGYTLGRRDGPPRPAARLRGRPRPRRRAGDGRGRDHAPSPRRATRSCSGRCAAARAASGSSSALEFDLVPVPRFFGGALFFTGAAIEPVLRAFGAWAPTLPEEVTTSVALLRLPPSDDVPPPLRGVVSLALRFGFTGAPDEGDALLAPMRAVADARARLVGPMSFAEVDRIHMDPPEPLPAVTRGAAHGSMPAGLVDALLAGRGPGRRRPAGAGRAPADGRRARPPGRDPERGGRARRRVRADRRGPGAAAAGGRRPRRRPRRSSRRGAVDDRNGTGQLRGPRRATPEQPVDSRGPRPASSGQGRRRPARLFGGAVSASAPRRGGCAMNRQVVVVEPGQGDRVGNVEFLARTVDTPYFNLGIVALEPGQGVDGHRHDGGGRLLPRARRHPVGHRRRRAPGASGRARHVRAGPRGTAHALANDGPDGRPVPQRPRPGRLRPADRPAVNVVSPGPLGAGAGSGGTRTTSGS